MGLLRKVPAGSVPRVLMESGLVGRATIVAVAPTDLTIGTEDEIARVCAFSVKVALEGRAPYLATCRQAIRTDVLPLLQPGAALAVRVDPEDLEYLALSLGEQPPTARAASRRAA